MKTTTKQALKTLSKKAGFNLSDARKAGITHTTVFRLEKEGIISKLERGLYSVKGSEPYGAEGDFSLAALKFGKEVVVGGLSALFHYHLIDEIPSQVWLLVPPSLRTTDKQYRLLRTSKSLRIGVIKADGYKIVAIERALVDGLVYSSKFGERLVKSAILRALKNRYTNEENIFKMAKRLGASAVVEREWQSILAGLAS